MKYMFVQIRDCPIEISLDVQVYNRSRMDEGSPPRPRDAETIADIEGDGGQGHKLSSIGRYVILDSVGMGGMGLVCAAYDPKLNRKVALKLLRNAADETT